MKTIKTFNNNKKEKGQGLTEYAVVVCLVAVASIATAALLGGAIKNKMASLASAISGRSTHDIRSSENKAKNAAEKAEKNASKVNSMKVEGMTDGGAGASVFDSINL